MTAPRDSHAATVQEAFRRAFALHGQGHLAQAETAYRAILKSQQRHFEAARLLGMLLIQRGDLAEAERQLRRALKFRTPQTPRQSVAETCNSHGVALIQLGLHAKALESLDEAVTLQPGMAGALANRAWALSELGRLEEAVACADKAIAADPGFAAVHNTRAKALTMLKRLEEALAGYDRAIALKPDYHEARHGRSVLRLMFGDFAGGWQDAEHRRYLDASAHTHKAHAPLSVTPKDFAGKHVLVAAEQGVGDEIMFASLIPDLMRDAGRVTLECDRRLAGLFARSFPGVETLERHFPPEWDAAKFDYVVPSLSLARFYRGSRGDFPARLAYLSPLPEIAARWRDRLAGLGEGPKIGISWKGGTDRTRGDQRSIPLEQWSPLLGIAGIQFVSLQYGDTKEEVERVNRGLSRPVVHIEASEIDDFDALAGLVGALDLVISVQTAVVHLSGAIGAPCLALLADVPGWSYGLKADHPPWYLSVTLLRQDEPGDWQGPLGRAADAVRRIALRHPPVNP